MVAPTNASGVRPLLVASQNEGKVRELQTLLSDLPFQVIGLKDCGLTDMDVPETGTTFEENALLKARAYSQASGYLTVADDSGLEVAALGGRPGVLSARFVTGGADARNQAILDELSDKSDRTAQFRTELCLFDPADESHQFFSGVMKGRIHSEVAGSEGWDYDMIFIPEGYDSTFAQLGYDVKNAMSHRAAAAQLLKEHLVKNVVTKG
jgi:XTP/dITP diphosphohydrolase